MLTIIPTFMFSLAACLTEDDGQILEADDPIVEPDEAARVEVVHMEEENCHGGPAVEPQSCTDYAWQCGGVNAIGVATSVAGQMIPGCNAWDGIDIAVDVCNVPNRDVSENLAIWACNVLQCLPPSASANPQVVAANAACAAGTVLATAIRCAAMADLCETERRNAQPICLDDYPCPYRPTVQACDPDGSTRDQTDITRECGTVVGGLGVTGPIHSSCMASCVGGTIAAGTSCWGTLNDATASCEIDSPL